MPGGFRPFSFDPHATPSLNSNNALDRKICKKIHNASLNHLNETKMGDIQGLYSDSNLHFPSNDQEFEVQLRSFLCLARGLFGENCYIAQQTKRLLTNFYTNKPRYISNALAAKDDLYFGRILFALDQGIQNFVEQLNHPTSINNINFKEFNAHIDYIIFNVKTGQPLGSLPPALEAKLCNQQRKRTDKKRNSDHLDSSTTSNKRSDNKNQKDSSKTSSKPREKTTFDSPAAGDSPTQKTTGKSSPTPP